MKKTGRGSGMIAIGILALVGSAIVSVATHVPDCVIESADSNTYIEITVPSVSAPETWYLEERPTIDPGPTVPGSGFATFGETHLWREENDLPGLQRWPWAADGPLACTPGNYYPIMTPCRGSTDDNAVEETCGHGWDTEIVGVGWQRSANL